MTRDELVKRLSALPPEAEIDIQIGAEHLDVADIVPWGDENFVALVADPIDLRDVLVMWGVPPRRRNLLIGDG